MVDTMPHSWWVARPRPAPRKVAQPSGTSGNGGNDSGHSVAAIFGGRGSRSASPTTIEETRSAGRQSPVQMRVDAAASSAQTIRRTRSASPRPRSGSPRDGSSRRDGSSPRPHEIFCKCTFTLSHALPDEEKALLLRLLKANGGTITESAPAAAPGSPSARRVHYSVCPHGVTSNTFSLPASARGQQELSGSDYHVTKQWVQACINTKRLLAANKFPEFSPLAYQLPLDGAERCNICVSGFVGPVRLRVIRAVELIGANSEERMSKRSTTILVCAKPEGDKYTNALTWKIPVVSLTWLNNVLQSGKLPELDAGTNLVAQDQTKIGDAGGPGGEDPSCDDIALEPSASSTHELHEASQNSQRRTFRPVPLPVMQEQNKNPLRSSQQSNLPMSSAAKISPKAAASSSKDSGNRGSAFEQVGHATIAKGDTRPFGGLHAEGRSGLPYVRSTTSPHLTHSLLSTAELLRLQQTHQKLWIFQDDQPAGRIELDDPLETSAHNSSLQSAASEASIELGPPTDEADLSLLVNQCKAKMMEVSSKRGNDDTNVQGDIASDGSPTGVAGASGVPGRLARRAKRSEVDCDAAERPDDENPSSRKRQKARSGKGQGSSSRAQKRRIASPGSAMTKRTRKLPSLSGLADPNTLDIGGGSRSWLGTPWP